MLKLIALFILSLLLNKSQVKAMLDVGDSLNFFDSIGEQINPQSLTCLNSSNGEILEYNEQKMTCNMKTPTTLVKAPLSSASEIVEIFNIFYELYINFTTDQNNQNGDTGNYIISIILQDDETGSHVRKILIAPVLVVLVLGLVLVSLFPCCAARCCCAKCCCKPRYKIDEFPSKGCCGWILPLFVSLVLSISILIVCFITFGSFSSIFTNVEQLSCSSMTVSQDLPSWASRSIVQINFAVGSELSWLITSVNDTNTDIDGLEKLVQNISDSYEATQNALISNFTDLETKYPEFPLDSIDVSSYFDINISDYFQAFDEGMAIAQKSIDEVVSAIANITTALDGKVENVTNDMSCSTNMVTEPVYGFTSDSLNANNGKVNSIFPALPSIPVLLPEGVREGESANVWTAVSAEKSPFIALILFLPIILPCILIILGTIIMSLRYCKCCIKLRKDVSAEKNCSAQDNNLKIRLSKRKGSQCCGCCASRCGWFSMWIVYVIYAILSIILLISSEAMGKTCSVMVLPKNSNDLTYFLEGTKIFEKIGIDAELGENLTKLVFDENQSNNAKAIQNILLANGININEMIDEFVQLNITESLNISSYVEEILNIEDTLRSSNETFFSQLYTNSSEMNKRIQACNVCSGSEWAIAEASYSNQGFPIGSTCSDATAAPGFCSSEARTNCTALLCSGVNISTDLNSIASEFSNFMLDQISNLQNIISEVVKFDDRINATLLEANTRTKGLVEDSLNSLDFSAVSTAYSDLIDPVCHGIYSGWYAIAWCSFAMCLLIPVLLIVQPILHVRLGGIGQKYSVEDTNKDTHKQKEYVSSGDASLSKGPQNSYHSSESILEIKTVQPITMNPVYNTEKPYEIEMTSVNQETNISNDSAMYNNIQFENSSVSNKSWNTDVIV